TERALAALAKGKVDIASALLARARASGRRGAEAHYQLAESLRPGSAAAAQQHYRLALAADPGHALAHANLGALLKEQGSAVEAARLLERALELRPELPEAAFNLAMLRIDQRKWRQAEELLARFLAAQPRDADGHYWRANALMGLGDAAGARLAYAAALRAAPQYAQARWGLVMAQLPAIALSEEEQQQGVAAFARELGALQQWVRDHPKADMVRAVGAQQPFFLPYVEQDHRPLLQQYGALCASLLAGWARKVGVPAPAPAARGKLKVGIVSAHIHAHSVWHAVLRGWLEHLDPARFELHLFHTGSARDAETEWAARRVPLHQRLGEWTAWAKAISDAKFDVLIYPEIGMDAATVRLASLRLARVQLAGWGHPITSGLPTLDGYLSAEAFEPPGAQQHYSERLIALPRLGCAYRPYGTAPQKIDIASLGVQPRDRLLICPGIPFKYAPRDDALLVEVARRCQPCKLVFFRPADDAHADRLAQRLRAAFTAAGLDFEACVLFVPWQSQAAFFGLLQRAHVFLDTVGFSGFNTVMQAIECGTPVVAWEGRFMRGRFASGVLRQMGLQEWVADSVDAYAQKVASLCADDAARAAVSKQIRERRGALYNDKGSVDALAAELERLAAA
ncbi:MAG: putative O-linked N-acetylglucosamine transferase, family, partial [Ramlibacter sp.]|nr:putative O-linked N-acetylglucosamine transferase, family [Ramlibacter sp.]